MSGTQSTLQFKPESVDKIKEIRSRYPEDRNQAALLPVLHLAQDEFGYISSDVIQLVSETLDVPRSEIEEVVTFYTMFFEEPIGTYNIQVCHNISCAIMGAEGLIHHIEKKLGIHNGEVTPDGRFRLTRVECLAGCDGAPMIQLNDKFIFDVTPESFDKLVDELSE